MTPHRDYLLLALQQAQIRHGHTWPNPAVGAVLVRRGELLCSGNHSGTGHVHAEVEVLNKIRKPDAADILYVTLEPCCHHGRTPPCTDLIIEKGIRTVYFAYFDPNKKVSGQGQQQLLQAGIKCVHIEVAEINAFYRAYAFWRQNAIPRVTAKIAVSEDLQYADENYMPIALTGDKANEYTHQQRQSNSVVMTSVNTITNDDPQMNVRLDGAIISKCVVVLDYYLQTPSDARVFSTAGKLIILYCEDRDNRLTFLQSSGATCYEVMGDAGRVDLCSALRKLGELGVHDVWLEVGGRLLQSFLSNRLCQRFLLYIAPKLIGSKGCSFPVKAQSTFSKVAHVEVFCLGEDTVIEWLF